MVLLKQGRKSSIASVLLPIYNGEHYLEQCLNSILNQTQDDFEVIIVDDGSTDESISSVLRYSDERITLLANEHDFVSSLNSALSYCAGKYIIRVDVDDYSYRNRLQEQITFLESNPDITICASYMEKMDSGTLMANQISGYIKNFLEILLLGNPIAHPTVAIRKDFLYRNNLVYKHNFPFAEDYQLWVDIAKCGGSGYILPIPLVQYRISETQVSFINAKQQEQSAYMIKRDLLNYFFETNPQIKTTLQAYLNAMQGMVEIGAMTTNEIFEIFYAVFIRLKLNKENS